MTHTIISLNPCAHDLTGQTFGRLVAIAPVERKSERIYWLCICDCGTEHIVNTGKLKSGNTSSCGCYRSEVGGANKLSHGMAGTTEYESWNGMKARCENANNNGYKNYGGRGIKVKYKDFHDFHADVGDKPSPELSIDRINNNGHYERGNCKWSTAKEQANNRRPRRC